VGLQTLTLVDADFPPRRSKSRSQWSTRVEPSNRRAEGKGTSLQPSADATLMMYCGGREHRA
jgi:hypothetical protein